MKNDTQNYKTLYNIFDNICILYLEKKTEIKKDSKINNTVLKCTFIDFFAAMLNKITILTIFNFMTKKFRKQKILSKTLLLRYGLSPNGTER